MRNQSSKVRQVDNSFLMQGIVVRDRSSLVESCDWLNPFLWLKIREREREEKEKRKRKTGEKGRKGEEKEKEKRER